VVVRWVVAAVVLFAVWTHWRAAYTADVRAAADDLPASAERLEELVLDLRDKRLAYRCKAVLRDLRAGDDDLCSEHLGDVRERLDHLERFAPLRRALARPPDR
jgi:hypothetical protein